MGDWYAIPGKNDKPFVCWALGCSMNTAITDGKRAFFEQHSTEHALRHSISLRVNHGHECHKDDGHCINCGQQEWIYNQQVGVFQCVSCTAQGILTAQQLLAVASFPKASESLLAELPHAHAAPKDEEEQTRSRAFASEYLAWRLGKSTTS